LARAGLGVLPDQAVEDQAGGFEFFAADVPVGGLEHLLGVALVDAAQERCVQA
jgi:hypothetical protein